MFSVRSASTIPDTLIRIAAAGLSLLCMSLMAACSGGGDESPEPTEQNEDCDGRTDLTRGTIDGPACDMAYEITGRSVQSDICTEYTFNSSFVDEAGTCDRAGMLGYCINVDERDPNLVTLIYRYEDPSSSLDDCDELELKSYQCLNRPGNTWCNAPKD